MKRSGPLFGTLPLATAPVVRMLASVVAGGEDADEEARRAVARPVIETASPAVSGRRQYSKSFQQPVFSEPSVPGTVGSVSVFTASATPGRMVGAPAIDVAAGPAAAPGRRERREEQGGAQGETAGSGSSSPFP